MTPDDDVLVCEFSLRPRGAPSLFDVAPFILQVSREAGALEIVLDPNARTIAREYTEAERLCCPTISWKLKERPALRLRVSTTPGRLRTLEAMFADARSTS